MGWFRSGFSPARRKEASRKAEHWLEAIASCALHPMYLDDAAVRLAGVDSEYLEFADALHAFHLAAEMEFAAKDILGLSPDFIEEQWALHLPESEPANAMLRAARVCADRLIEVAAEWHGI
ncbi:hypothetical protein [Arthrobacter sp. SW1]|uniref:hypothetical protein n=1 Tax=Arthrobacter sp. SW1 TaxID=1920889 RepID=UPI0011131509|nr:hypothetical protein [Arthrobacter sp. SW1]